MHLTKNVKHMVKAKTFDQTVKTEITMDHINVLLSLNANNSVSAIND